MTTQKKALVAIYIMSFVVMLHGMTNTTIAYIIDSYSELPPVSVQQLVSLPSIFGLIVSFILGPIAMKINKKYLTLFTGMCVIIYFAIFAFVGSNGPFFLLLLATVPAGIAMGAAMTLISSMIGEFVGAEKRANCVAISMALMNGGNALMAILGGAIAARGGGDNWSHAYYLGVFVIPALILFNILMPKNPSDATTASPASGEGPAQAESAAKEKLPFRDIVICILTIFISIFVCGFLFYVSL
jgi:MFS family permease